MNNETLYTSHNLATRIKERAKIQNVIIKDMLVDCKLGSNTMSAMYHGKSIAFDSLAKIADYLDCSVDYLLGRTQIPVVFPMKQNEKLKVNVNLNKLFFSDDPLRRYMLHLWEAWNDVCSINTLFFDLINTNLFGRCMDWFIVFKHNIIALNELINILIFQFDTMQTPKPIIFDFLNSNNLREQYDEQEKFFKENKRLCKMLRDLAAHFDHEKDSKEDFCEFVKSQNEYELCIENGLLSDSENPVYLELMIYIYKENMNKTNLNKDEAIIEIVKLYSDLIDKAGNLSRSMLEAFFGIRLENLEFNISVNKTTYGHLAAFGFGTKQVEYTEQEAKESDKARDQFHYESMSSFDDGE